MPLLRVGVPGAGVADGVDVGEALALAAEIVEHGAQRVQERVEPRVVEDLLGVDFAVAELLVQAGHADEQGGDVVLDLVRPDLLAVAGPAPLLHVVLHLRLDFQVAAAQEEEEGLDLQLVDVALEEVGDLAALDDLHLLFEGVGLGALALLDARAHRPHPRHVEEVHLLDHLPPVVAEAVGQHGHDQLQHAGLDRLQLLVAHAACRGGTP